MEPSPPPPLPLPSSFSYSISFLPIHRHRRRRSAPPPALAGRRVHRRRIHMSRPVGSDLRRRNYPTATNDGHQSTSNDGCTKASGKARQRFSFLFSGAGAGAWRRSEGGGTTAAGAESRSGGGKRSARGNSSSRRGGLGVGQVVKKYMAMAEQLFASFAGGGRERERRELRRRPHSFTSGPDWSGGGGPSSRRHMGRLSSAPASLRGSPANSGHLSLGASVTTSSEHSTMEELQSAIQAAIAHCKNSVAVAKHAGGDSSKC